MNVSSIPTTRINKDHPIELIIRDLHSALLTRRMSQQNLKEHCLVSYINKQRRTNHKDYQNCLFACFLSQKEPKKVIQALEDPSWIEAMQEELLQFELQKVWTLVDLPNGKRAIGTKWVFRNKKDERGIVVRNKARLTASTPMEPNKALVKDEEAEAVDVHLYRSMIGSLMYLTASRPDIMFAVYACARFQVTPKTSHIHAVKRIFRYLKGQPKLGLWYPKDSPFDLEAFSDSDYAGASLDRKSTTGGCQFLGRRLISWQCKKQTIVANSTTEAEYVAAANCCGQKHSWIQNPTGNRCQNHKASIQTLKPSSTIADKKSGGPSGSLPSNSQPNPKAHNSKAYQPPQSRNEHVNAVFTRSGKSYNPLVNPNDQQNDSETPINFDSDDKDEEPTPQTKTQNSKSVKEILLPKPYKPKILYPQRLRKEKMEAQYRKFLDMIRELISNKHKIEQISAAFLSDESSAMIQNKVPPKLGDPRSFLIPCNFNKTFSCNALADLGASINLMPYSLYAKLSLETLKPTKISVRLADRSFQYPVGIAENMLVEVVIRVKQKQLNLGVGTERMIFNIDSAMKHSYSNDDTCFSIDVIDEILEEDFDALLDEGSKILYSIEGTLLEEEIFAEFDEFMAMTADENSDSESDTEDPPFKKITINTDYKIKTSLEEPPTDLELKPLPDNLEYVFLEEPSFLPVIISSQLSKEKKNKLIYVLKKHKQAFAWKMTDIPGICPSFCKHKIQLLDENPKETVVQKQRRLNPNMQEVVKKEIVQLLDTCIIYPIANSPWVSPINCVPKKVVYTNSKKICYQRKMMN
ncbi:reverse transcriptase domain-containing protein [Tanacetum coccineum]